MKGLQSRHRAIGAAVEALELRQLLAGTAAGVVYHDLNGNGVRDGGEPGVSGRTVFVDANNNFALDTSELTTTTNATGNYTIAGIPDGPANIVHDVPADYDITAPPLGLARVIITANQTTTVTPLGSRL